MDYPVPVRNYNLRSSDGTFPNQNKMASLEENDVFVRRFFLFDRVILNTSTASPRSCPALRNVPP
eukprot:25989-Eustigmatos_ZCMA.PRE.1